MRRIVSVAVVSLLLVGCGHSSALKGGAQGSITYKGKPVNGGALLLFPVSGGDTGGLPVPISQEGTFGTGTIPPGDYKVVVQGNTALPSNSAGQGQFQQAATIDFPKKYKDVKTTTLKMTIGPGQQKQDLELTD